jgi:phosphoribosylaminoimidazole (AIR) synthetase
MVPLTCRDAGVDMEAGDEAVRRIARRTTSTRPEVLIEPVPASTTDAARTTAGRTFLADRRDSTEPTGEIACGE